MCQAAASQRAAPEKAQGPGTGSLLSSSHASVPSPSSHGLCWCGAATRPPTAHLLAVKSRTQRESAAHRAPPPTSRPTT